MDHIKPINLNSTPDNRRYAFEEKREYDITLGQAIEIYKKNFGHQPSFKTAKWIFIRHIKEYFVTDTPLMESSQKRVHLPS